MTTGHFEDQKPRARTPRAESSTRLSALMLCGTAVLTTHMALASGITADEIVQRIYGDLIPAYFRSGFADQRALSFINLYLYGGSSSCPRSGSSRANSFRGRRMSHDMSSLRWWDWLGWSAREGPAGRRARVPGDVELGPDGSRR